MLRIALAQINTTVGDLAGNEQKILEYSRRAQAAHADIVVFPELAVTGYPPEDLLLKEQFVSENLKVLRSLAKATKNIIAVVGFVDRDSHKNLYNAAAVLAAGQVKGIYHKHELPNYGVFDEKRYFKEGTQAPLFTCQGHLLAVNICEDIWIDKSVYVAQAKLGAKLFINLSSSPYHVGKLELREKLLQKRAKEAKAFVCYTNLVGGQDELVFDGGSLVVDSQGKTVALGKQFEEDLVVVDLNLPAAKKNRKTIPLPSFRKEKQLAVAQLSKKLSPLESIFKALVLGTRDYIQKNGFKQVVIGLSGGIDSALVAVIAKEAIGKENVIGITMPSRFSSQGTRSDAKGLAENLGIRLIEIPIEGIAQSYSEVFAQEFAGQPVDITEENLQARIRGNILMAFSNKFGWLVLTTGNKSEIAVGYCTLYGDMSGGFAVIKDVPKTTIYELADWINQKFGGVVPQSTIDRAPTAELRENQTDQDSLPPYPVLDEVLKAYVEDHQSLAAMKKKYKSEGLIKGVMKMVDKSEYKRRQAAPGVKITARAFGKDWRLPITNWYKEF